MGMSINSFQEVGTCAGRERLFCKLLALDGGLRWGCGCRHLHGDVLLAAGRAAAAVPARLGGLQGRGRQAVPDAHWQVRPEHSSTGMLYTVHKGCYAMPSQQKLGQAAMNTTGVLACLPLYLLHRRAQMDYQCGTANAPS